MLLESKTGVLAPRTLLGYTGPGLLVPDLNARDTAGVISELSQVLRKHECIPDVLPFYHTALNQELLFNSSLPCGVALPHARLAGVKQLHFAFGRIGEPISWGCNGSAPVQFVFLLAVPATDAATYLHLLASICRFVQQSSVLAELRAARSAKSILSLFEKAVVR